MDVPLGFEIRAVGVEPGGHRIYHRAEWGDALVLVRRGSDGAGHRRHRCRGLRSGLIGTPEQIAERILELEAAGLDLEDVDFGSLDAVLVLVPTDRR